MGEVDQRCVNKTYDDASFWVDFVPVVGALNRFASAVVYGACGNQQKAREVAIDGGINTAIDVAIVATGGAAEGMRATEAVGQAVAKGATRSATRLATRDAAKAAAGTGGVAAGYYGGAFDDLDTKWITNPDAWYQEQHGWDHIEHKQADFSWLDEDLHTWVAREDYAAGRIDTLPASVDHAQAAPHVTTLLSGVTVPDDSPVIKDSLYYDEQKLNICLDVGGEWQFASSDPNDPGHCVMPSKISQAAYDEHTAPFDEMKAHVFGVSVPTADAFPETATHADLSK